MFNASLLAVGALNVAGGLLEFHGRPRVLAAFLVAGAGAMGAGLFPLDTVTPHALSAFAAFVGFNVEAIVSGTTLRGPMRAISVLLGVIGLVFVVLMAIGDSGTGAAFGPIGHRATEQLIVYPPMLWLLAFGGYLMRERDGTAS